MKHNVTRTVVKRRKPRYKAKVYSHKDKTNKQTKTKNKTNKTKIKKNKKHKKQRKATKNKLLQN
jgi:hypothetical protein